MAKARKKPRGWSPGDLSFAVKVMPQKGGEGGWVYLPREHLAEALFGMEGHREKVNVSRLVAARTVLDPGTGQILIRIKKLEKVRRETP